jgi:transcriptional regulator with XRE-family HTH domain
MRQEGYPVPLPAPCESPHTLPSTITGQEGTGVARAKRSASSTAVSGGETVGQRLARLRRERGLTQAELAGRLGIAQPIVSDYERGELRLHGQLIVRLTEILGVSADELLGLTPTPDAGPQVQRRLVRRLRAIDRLPRRDQQALFRTIDAFLKSAGGG